VSAQPLFCGFAGAFSHEVTLATGTEIELEEDDPTTTMVGVGAFPLPGPRTRQTGPSRVCRFSMGTHRNPVRARGSGAPRRRGGALGRGKGKLSPSGGGGQQLDHVLALIEERDVLRRMGQYQDCYSGRPGGGEGFVKQQRGCWQRCEPASRTSSPGRDHRGAARIRPACARTLSAHSMSQASGVPAGQTSSPFPWQHAPSICATRVWTARGRKPPRRVGKRPAPHTKRAVQSRFATTVSMENAY
jgi:hypothetical protein